VGRELGYLKNSDTLTHPRQNIQNIGIINTVQLEIMCYKTIKETRKLIPDGQK